jgi:NCS2 family nucleobase:cation symporter-2
MPQISPAAPHSCPRAITQKKGRAKGEQMLSWKLHGDGKTIASGEVVSIDERLTWPRTIGMGMQHIVAMFGATFLVPIITGFPPTTTLFFSGIGTLLFILLTQNKLPSYLGSSFAFLAPVAAAKTEGGIAAALGGIVVTGVLLALVGFAAKAAGTGWIETFMPPVVTGTIVMVIGLNLAGAAKNDFMQGQRLGLITLLSIGLIGAFFRGFLGRISIFAGLVIGYAYAALMGDVNFDGVKNADWVGLPTFTSPSFSTSAVILFLPVVLVLIAENVGHVKAVAAMTGKNLDDQIGNALIADGAATTLAGLGGGSGTTTYVYGTVQTRSDIRDKDDVIDIPIGVNFINKLKPKFYRWNYREDYIQRDLSSNIIYDGTKKRIRFHAGLIAQDVKESMDEYKNNKKLVCKHFVFMH